MFWLDFCCLFFVEPGLVVGELLVEGGGLGEVKGYAEHVGVAEIVDHHVVMAGDGDAGTDGFDDRGGLRGGEVVGTAVDDDSAEVRGLRKELAEALVVHGVAGVEEGDAVRKCDEDAGVVEVYVVSGDGEGGLKLDALVSEDLARVEEALRGFGDVALVVNADGVVGAYEEGFARSEVADGFYVGVVFVGVSGEEDVNVEVRGLNEDGELAVEAEGQVRVLGGAGVGEVEVDGDEEAGGVFEEKAVLAEEPEGDGMVRDVERADLPHVVRAWDERGHDELDGRGAVVGVVLCEVVRLGVHGVGSILAGEGVSTAEQL